MTDGDIERRLGKLESAVAVVQHQIADVKDDTGKIETHLKELNGTVATVVAWRWWLTGAGASLTFLVVVFGALVVGLVMANS